ncbi:hypothetical protein Pyn_07632 [Prunus yedoensis var. nudiflora]|uniref:Uncharacterized protein n=1 Tax=Prunus yedoensis var. nudiflora TaxID=2094558 RepID=A0A314YG49_PRUYE|nr:hypothetical protein Pyn_07632 [Prunus yedoensis var. nudiflora]
MEQRLSLIQQSSACLHNLINQPDALAEEYARANKDLRNLSASMDLINQFRANKEGSLVPQSQELMPMRTTISILLL